MANYVNISNIYSATRNNIVELIDDYSNVSDPTINTSYQHRKWIYSREPDVLSNEFKGFPYIIIRPVSPAIDTNKTGSRQISEMNFTIHVEIVTSDRGFNQSNGNGLSHIDTISESVYATIYTESNLDTLHGNGLDFIDITPSETQTVSFKNTLVYRRVLTITCNSKRKLF